MKRKPSVQQKADIEQALHDGVDRVGISPSPSLDFYAARRLSKALGVTADRLGLPGEYAHRIFTRLFFPVRLLALLRKEAEAVLSCQTTAPDRFIGLLRHLEWRLPPPAGALARLRKLVGAKRSCRHPYPSPLLVSFESVATLYQAAFLASGGDRESMNEAFGFIAGLSQREMTIETLHLALVGGGQSALDDRFAWGVALGRGPFCVASMPGREPVTDPGGDPWGGGTPGDPWGGIPGGWGEPAPGDPGFCDEPPWPPVPGDDDWLRQSCEGLLVDIFNGEAPSLRALNRRRAWADNIENILLEGTCSGDWMLIQGQGFGDTQADNLALIAKTLNGCRELEVDAGNWSDTEIRVQLPDDIVSGAVGFYDKLANNAFNSWVGDVNASASQILSASACLGKPLIFPGLQPMIGIPCPPPTDVNVIAVGLPVIRRFQASAGGDAAETILLTPTDLLELSWEVENAQSLTLTRLTTAGPDIPGGLPFGSQQYLSVTGMSSLLFGPSLHGFIGVSQYSLRAENDCGHVDRVITVLLTRRPALEIVAIQVTQGMQTQTGEVVLVAGKPTVVRLIGTHAMAEVGQPSLPGVWGRIRYFNEAFPAGTGWDAPINHSDERPPEPDFGARINLPTTPNLGITDHTVNFLIPEALCHGKLDIEVELRVNGAGGIADIDGFSEVITQRFDAFDFAERKPIRIRYIPVTVDPDATGTLTMAPDISNPPTDQQCRDLIEESMQQIPTTAESISRHDSYSIRISLDRTIIQTPFGEFSRSLGYDIFGNSHLEWIRLIRICGFIDITGLFCPEDDDAYWAIIVPTTGGWGRAHIGGREYLTPYRPTSAGHELAHCLNQQHLSVQCPNGLQAPGGTDPGNFENGGVVTGIPFDILNNTALSGSVFDLMTYCSTRWVSAQRWQQIFDELGPP